MLPPTVGGVRVAGDPDAVVERIAVLGGSGDDRFAVVRAAEADVYVTADLRHHVLLQYDDPDGRHPWLHWKTWLEIERLTDLRPAGTLSFSGYDQIIPAAIAGHGVELLHQWGLLDTVLATGVPNPRTVGYAVGADDDSCDGQLYGGLFLRLRPFDGDDVDARPGVARPANGLVDAQHREVVEIGRAHV